MMKLNYLVVCAMVRANDDEHGHIMGNMRVVAKQLCLDEHGEHGWRGLYNFFRRWTAYISMIIPEVLIIVYCIVHYV